MKKVVLVLCALALGACASTKTDEEKLEDTVNETDAVMDFVNLHDLKKVSSIRRFDNPGHLIINPRYIIAYVKDDQYLLQYAHDCRMAATDAADRLPDSRRRGRMLSVRTDTFRGCPVRKMWEVTYAQAEELMAVGRAPVE